MFSFHSQHKYLCEHGIVEQGENETVFSVCNEQLHN